MNIFNGLTNFFKGWKEKDSIYTGNSGFFGFGGSKVSINKIFTSSQDNTLLIDYFNNVAEVAACPLKYMEGAKQVILKANIPEVQDLIDKPNDTQGGNELFALQILYKRLLGNSFENAFVTPTVGSTPKPKKLFLFTPQYTAIQTDKDEDFRFRKIQKYIFPKNTKSNIEIEPEEMLHLKESNPNFDNNSYLFGLSRYVSCASAIQSITGGYGAKVNLFTNGPRFIITGKGGSKDAYAATNAVETESIEKVQKRFSLYGWAKNQYNNWITDKPLEVHNASLNVGQLKLTEHNTADFMRLCDAQGIDVKVFSENGKFDDKALALSDFYNNAFRSEIDSTVEDKQNFYRQWWPDLELKADYSNISEIVNAQDKENKRIFEDVKIGLLTRNQYLEQTGKEIIINPEFYKLYTFTESTSTWTPLEPETINPDESAGFSQEQLAAQANLRGSVGGVQGILGIQASVQQGITDYSAAIATLMEIYGFDLATSQAILGTPGTATADPVELSYNDAVTRLNKVYGFKVDDCMDLLKAVKK